MKFLEDSEIEFFKPRKTTEGNYLIAFSRVARAGVQHYRGAEVGVTQDTVALYRPPEEVFAVDSVSSYVGKPITLDHPWPAVDSKNWSQFAKGYIGEGVLREGRYLRIPLAVMDAAAIERVEGGKDKLSAGYDMAIDWTAGEDPETGERYDGIMRKIRINHVAIVDAARAGATCRIGDEVIAHPIALPNKPEKKTMEKTTVYDLNGVTIDSLERAVEELRKRDATIADINAKLSARDGDLAKRDLEIDALKKAVADAKLSDAAISELVKSRSRLMSDARLIIGDKAADELKIEDMAEADARKAVVHAAKGEGYVKDKTPEYITAAFSFLADSAHEAKKSGGAAPAAGSPAGGVVGGVMMDEDRVFPRGFRMPGASQGSSADIIRDAFMARPTAGRAADDDGQEKYEQDLENGWKQRPGMTVAK